MSRRVQLSLLFEDADLYDGLVIPWKANRELSPLVIKLLSAYFYSDEIRGLVDCFREEEIICEEAQSSYEEAINNARNTLAFMNMLTDGAKSVLSGGIEEINSIASATGGEPAKETKFGMGLPSFKNVADLQENAAEGQTEAESAAPVVDNDTNERISSLETQLSAVLQTLTTLNATVNTLASQGAVHNTGVVTNAPKVVEPVVDEIDVFDEPVSAPVQPAAKQRGTALDERKISAELDELVDSIVDQSSEKSGGSTLDEANELVETLVAESEHKKSITSDSEFETEEKEAESTATNEKINNATEENSESLSDDTQKPEETPKLKDGSDSLRAFLNNGVGFAVEF